MYHWSLSIKCWYTSNIAVDAVPYSGETYFLFLFPTNAYCVCKHQNHILLAQLLYSAVYAVLYNYVCRLVIQYG